MPMPNVYMLFPNKECGILNNPGRSHYNRLRSNVTQQRILMMKRTLLALAITVVAATPVMADEALAKSKNCLACHTVDKKLVGPSYKDVAKKHAGSATAVDELTTKIMKGSKGVYGPVPMPPNAQVNEADAKKLATWIMSLK